MTARRPPDKDSMQSIQKAERRGRLMRQVTALALVVALSGVQPLLAAAPEASPASAAVSLPDAPDAPNVPVFPGVHASPAQAGSLQGNVPKSLHIVILDGEGALNNIKERTAREPIVQIEDENHKPVAGASVLFLIQNGNAGAGGTFGGAGSLTSSYSTVTDAAGRAVGRGLRPNATSGQYTISVTASVGMVVAQAVINMSNIAGAGAAAGTSAGAISKVAVHTHHAVPRWAIIGGAVVVATVVVVVTVVATNGSKGATIAPGTGTITP